MGKLPTSEPGTARRRRRPTRAIKGFLRELSNQLSLLNHHVSAHIDLNDTDLDCRELINRHGPLNPRALARHAGGRPWSSSRTRAVRAGTMPWAGAGRSRSSRLRVILRAPVTAHWLPEGYLDGRRSGHRRPGHWPACGRASGCPTPQDRPTRGHRLPDHELQVDRQTTPHQPEATPLERTVAVASLLDSRDRSRRRADP
jgi:hypothetical protein